MDGWNASLSFDPSESEFEQSEARRLHVNCLLNAYQLHKASQNHLMPNPNH